MTRNIDQLAGDIDFRELIETLDFAIVALDSQWNILYHNNEAQNYFAEDSSVGRPFWETLTADFLDCFQAAYKKAILGYRNQLDFTESPRDTQRVNEEVFADLPLDLLEQKAVDFKFHCDANQEAYSIRFNHHQGSFLFRLETITERVEAHRQAEKNREELQETLEKMKEARNANPLTGLPGNIRIQEELSYRLDNDQDFALVHADLDNFKPFNDRYGFDRGDEALILVRDLLQTSLNRVGSEDPFLGHVGGDDFVVILEIPKVEAFCETVIDLFDRRVENLYDPDDLREGKIRTENRQGEQEEFGIMTITLAVVTTEDRSFENHLALTETAAEVKKFAKRNRHASNYVVNRRRENGDGTTSGAS